MRAVLPLEVWRARTVVDDPEPMVMVEPGESVDPEMMYWDCAFGVMISEPMVRAGGLVLVAPRMEVLGPYTRAVVSPDMCRARTVLEVSEPRVMEEPGFKVWPEIMYWDWAFGVMVWSLIVIGAGAFAPAGAVGKVSAEVVRILEPAALVVSRTMAARWVEVETMSPWALVDVMIVGRNAEIEAVERLVERTVLP